MIRVGIAGATGYAGGELVRILAGHPEVVLTVLTSKQYAGVSFSDIFPSMTNVINKICEPLSDETFQGKADVVFMALPHKLPMAHVPKILKAGINVIDLSADFRFNNAELYESVYQPHTAKELLPGTVYGLSEVYTQEIKEASLIGNPGCYPTSVLLPLIPLLKHNILDTASIVADSKSGVSGAGRAPSLTAHFCEVNDSFKAYKVAVHRHNPEMDAILSREAGKPVHITFVPHLVPMTRGMLTTLYANLVKDVSAEDIYEYLASYYEERHFVRLVPENRLPDTLHVRNTNFCDIGFRIDPRNNRLILISAIDNLVKGAAGQAVQNMNIMFGLDETSGLSGIPFPI